MTEAVTSLVEKISNNASISPDDVKTFTTHQVIYLLQALVESPAPLSIETLQNLGDAYKLVGSKNSEIQYRYVPLSYLLSVSLLVKALVV